MRQLDELAMEYVLTVHGVNPDKHYALMQVIIPVTDREHQASALVAEMDRFGVYQAQEAIKAAKKTLRLIYPDEG